MSRTRLYGLTFASEVPLPGAPDTGLADAEIRCGPEAARQCQDIPQLSIRPAPGGGWMFRADGIGAFWIPHGRAIHVSPQTPLDAPALRLFLLGSAMGMLLHQRGDHTLHAATLVRDETAIAFAGEQQAGKSTLSVTLARAGAAVFGDDTMVVWPGAEVWPGPADFKLWRQTAAALNLSGQPVSAMVDKVSVANPARTAERACRLGAVIELSFGPAEGGISAVPVTGLAAIDLIAGHVYRPEYIGLLGREAEHFAQAARLAAQTRVWRLTRPKDLARAPEVADWLSNEWPRLTRPVKEDGC